MFHPLALIVAAFCFGMTAGYTLRHRRRPRQAVLVSYPPDESLYALVDAGPQLGMLIKIVTREPRPGPQRVPRRHLP